jgi:DNA invertase Pin-like site-specific DNA recombinase
MRHSLTLASIQTVNIAITNSAPLRPSSCEKVFSEQVSAVSPERDELEAAIEFAREGDLLVCTKLDRLARSVPHLCEIGKRLDAKRVGLKVLDQAIDTTTPTGRLMFNMLGAIAQFERELFRERMLVGIAKAKAEGKYRGRAPTARNMTSEIRKLRAEGVGAILAGPPFIEHLNQDRD